MDFKNFFDIVHPEYFFMAKMCPIFKRPLIDWSCKKTKILWACLLGNKEFKIELQLPHCEIPLLSYGAVHKLRKHGWGGEGVAKCLWMLTWGGGGYLKCLRKHFELVIFISHKGNLASNVMTLLGFVVNFLANLIA